MARSLLPEETTLLDRHVELFNTGVRSGDFGAMLEHFVEDAELVFEGVPVGPYRGRQAIADAYREQPPDDEIRVWNARAENQELVADYRWMRDRTTRAGELRLAVVDARIRRLTVTFETT